MGKASPLRSIRTRLTAWYALLLLLIILLLGAGVSYVLERELRADVDVRLRQTGADMTSQFDVAFRFNSAVVIVPPPDAFSFPSQLIQVVDNSGRIWFRSENLGDRNLPFDLATVRDGGMHYGAAELDGVTIRTLIYPIVLRETNIGAVIVGEPLIQLTTTLQDLRRQFVFAAAIGAALAAVGGWFIGRRALRPVDQMTATARRIVSTSGDALPLATRLDFPHTGDEVARLGDTFNDLLDRLQSALELQRRFVADASHELRTPLTAVQGNIDLLEKQLEREQVGSQTADETIAELRRESRRMARLVTDLLTLARLESAAGLSLHPESAVEAREIAKDAIRTTSALHPDTRFHIEENGELLVTVDRDRLEQVMVILLDNAASHSDAGSTVTTRLSMNGSEALIEVQDQGSGIPADDLPHVFDRFYRVDSARSRVRGGTGLGLAIAQAVVKAHGGSIEIQSEPGNGTTVLVKLPVTATTFIGH